MQIDLVFRNETADKTWGQDFFARIVEVSALTLNPLPAHLSLSVNLIDETKSQELNREHRGKDKATNVLSFPVDKEAGDLGDIFICLSIAKSEAIEENIGIEQKLSWLTVHGFLHLCGYDHELSQNDAERMQKLEEEILRKPKLKVCKALKLTL